MNRIVYGSQLQTMNPIPSRPTVLLAERSLEQRNLIAGYLQRYGWRVIAAADSVDAVKLVSAGTKLNIDAFAVNCRMPRVNGIELIEWLRRKRPDTPVIFISTLDELARWDHSIILIRKQSHLRELLSRLNDVLESSVPELREAVHNRIEHAES